VLAAAAAPLAPRQVALEDACGRRLSDDLRALVDLPTSDNSAMDGWAFAGPPPWRVVADIPAGHPTAHQLRQGECASIVTGAPVPGGVTGVLPVEHSTIDLTGVRPTARADLTRSHIRRAGEEARIGDVLLPGGTTVSPPVIGLAAASGHDTLCVVPPAHVDVLVLGDELVLAGVPAPGQVRDALGPQLPGWLDALGCGAVRTTRVRDEPDLLDMAIAASTADILLTTGGTGPGPRDHVRAAVTRAGGRLVVDGVHVKPGHPMLLASLPSGRWLVGLPGNPYAACVALLTLVQPLLAALQGALPGEPATVLIGSDEPGRVGDGHRLLPVRATGGVAEVLPSCGSAMLRGLAQASGLAVIPPEGAMSGAWVEHLPLPWQR
jgi:molybdopterin molybdotransferase